MSISERATSTRSSLSSTRSACCSASPSSRVTRSSMDSCWTGRRPLQGSQCAYGQAAFASVRSGIAVKPGRWFVFTTMMAMAAIFASVFAAALGRPATSAVVAGLAFPTIRHAFATGCADDRRAADLPRRPKFKRDRPAMAPWSARREAGCAAAVAQRQGSGC